MSFLSTGSGCIGFTGGGGTDEKSGEHLDISSNNNTLSPHNTLHLNPNNPRARVISLSRSHRLSGVEVWEDSHRHPLAVPPPSFDDDDDNDGGRGSEVRDEDGVCVEQVKELEPGLGEKEDVEGIEALLEKDAVLPSVVVVPEVHEGVTPTAGGAGHGKESNSGSTNSRTGSLREPKSAGRK